MRSPKPVSARTADPLLFILQLFKIMVVGPLVQGWTGVGIIVAALLYAAGLALFYSSEHLNGNWRSSYSRWKYAFEIGCASLLLISIALQVPTVVLSIASALTVGVPAAVYGALTVCPALAYCNVDTLPTERLVAFPKWMSRLFTAFCFSLVFASTANMLNLKFRHEFVTTFAAVQIGALVCLLLLSAGFFLHSLLTPSAAPSPD